MIVLTGIILVSVLLIAGLIWGGLAFVWGLLFGGVPWWAGVLLALPTLLITLFIFSDHSLRKPSIDANTASDLNFLIRDLKRLSPPEAQTEAAKELIKRAEEILTIYRTWSEKLADEWKPPGPESQLFENGVEVPWPEEISPDEVAPEEVGSLKGFVADISEGFRSKMDFSLLLWQMRYNSSPPDSTGKVQELWWLWMRVKRYFPG